MPSVSSVPAPVASRSARVTAVQATGPAICRPRRAVPSSRSLLSRCEKYTASEIAAASAPKLQQMTRQVEGLCRGGRQGKPDRIGQHSRINAAGKGSRSEEHLSQRARSYSIAPTAGA